VPAELGNVLVTGGSSGLGAAVAAAVEEAGGTAIVLDRVAPANGFAFEQVDLAHPREAERAVARAAERAGGLDAVVTAAGTDACGDISDVDADAWDRVVLVNLLGTAAVVRAALPHLERSRGRVVTVASTLGLRALPAATAYCASKFGVVGFTRALAIEMGDRVGVTMLVPGGMKTHFFDDRPDDFKPAPDQLLNDPRDVAQSVLFALRQPPGVELRELLVTPAGEPSWP
jgi:NADP-dependent 3-hydroxy acid dehydrogenase YdfG